MQTGQINEHSPVSTGLMGPSDNKNAHLDDILKLAEDVKSITHTLKFNARALSRDERATLLKLSKTMGLFILPDEEAYSSRYLRRDTRSSFAV